MADGSGIAAERIVVGSLYGAFTRLRQVAARRRRPGPLGTRAVPLMTSLTSRVRPYLSSDWGAVCRVHDRARPIELAAFVPANSVAPMESVAAEDGFFDAQK